MTPRSPHKAMAFPADFEVNILDLPGVTLAEAGIELKDGDVTFKEQVPVPAVAEDGATARLENGHPASFKDKRVPVFAVNAPTEGNCKQAVKGDKLLWLAADGGDPVETSNGPEWQDGKRTRDDTSPNVVDAA